MNNNRLLLAIGAIIFCLQSFTAQTWQWATIEAGANGYSHSLAKDYAGNVFLAGYFLGSATIGANTYTSTSPNVGAGTFVLKYDASGNLLWNFVINSNNIQFADIDTDNSGDVYITFSFANSVVLGNYTLVSTGYQDMGVIKISNSGALIWAKSFGGTGIEFPFSIATDGSGNSVVCGYYQSPSITFSGTTLTGTVNSTVNNGYVAKFDPNGNVIWAKKIASSGLFPNLFVELDANSNAYVTGGFGNQITAGAVTLSSGGTLDFFVAKYSSTGALLWLIRSGAFGIELTRGIKADPLGNVYLSGSMNGTLCAIGSTTYAGTFGNSDAFIAKLDSSGNFLWSNRIASSGTEMGYNLAPSANDVFLSCLAQTTLITVGAQTYTFSNNTDGLLIAQYNSTGSLLNVFPLDGGASSDLSLDNCALYIGGTLKTPTVNFGNIALTHTTTSSPFLARLQLAVGEPTINISGTFSVCSGASATLQANGANSYIWSNGAASSSIVVSPTATAVYVVTGSSASLACAASKAQTVLVVPLPTVTAMRSSASICAGNSVTLSAIGALSYSWNTGAQTQVIVQTPSQPTVYSVTGFSTLCSATSSISVGVNALPVVSAVTDNSVICKNSSVVVSALGADTYTWFNGATTSAISVSPLVATVYTVTGTNSLTSCSGTASIQLSVDECTSLEEIKSKTDQFSLFPNPSNGEINIHSDNENELLLINMLGEKIINLHINANETLHLNFSTYGAGVYYLQSIQSLKVHKIIIESNP